jgi:hypothetical protein
MDFSNNNNQQFLLGMGFFTSFRMTAEIKNQPPKRLVFVPFQG